MMAAINWHHGIQICTKLFKSYSLRLTRRWFGQPAAQTHPHLLRDGDVTPGITKHEYRTRRQRLLDAILQDNSDSNVVIFPSAARSYMSHDIPYPFRQNTDFLYLTGFLEPNSILVLRQTSTESTSTLFVPRKDPERELWDGPRSGAQGAVTLTGVDEAYDMEMFDSYMSDCLMGQSAGNIWYDRNHPAHADYHSKHIVHWLGDQQREPVRSPRRFVQQLRLIKSPAEIKLMRRSCEITSQAFIETMKFSRPDINESDLYAKMDFECRLQGAEYLAYPPVVAGGDRANTIHYVSNNQLVRDGELLLMDAGCEYHGYTSDVTRTWPIAGRFTACQRDIYEALLEVQRHCVTLCRCDTTMDRVYLEMLALIGRQLQQLGVISRDIADTELLRVSRQFCPHHVGHYLGMDVHDTDEIPRNTSLSPGMIVTVEPGIYIPSSRIGVPSEMRGIGIRIEDDVLITSDQPEVLTHACPKHPDEIERIMSSRQ